jgi:hypothetical protein
MRRTFKASNPIANVYRYTRIHTDLLNGITYLCICYHITDKVLFS